MTAPREDDFITNSDESRRLPDENPEPLTGTKQEESNLLEADSETETEEEQPKPDIPDQDKKEKK